MSTKHNSVPEINVLSWLKFSKSVLSHLMLIWAKRNQLVLLAEAAGICSSKLCPPPRTHTHPVNSLCCCTPMYKLAVVSGAILAPLP